MKYHWKNVRTRSEFNRVLELLNDPQEKREGIALDTETSGIQPYNGDFMSGLSYSFPLAGENYYLSFRHGEPENLDKPEYHNLPIEWLQELIQAHKNNPDTRWILFNSLFDMAVLKFEGFPFSHLSTIEDVLIASILVNENENLSLGLDKEKGEYRYHKRGGHTLKRLAGKYLGDWALEGQEQLENALNERGYGKGEMWKLPSDSVAQYAAFDTLLTYKMREFYMPHLQSWGVKDLYNKQNKLLVKYWFPAQWSGVKTDRKLLEEFKVEAEQQIKEFHDYFDSMNLRSIVDEVNLEWLESTDMSNEEIADRMELDEDDYGINPNSSQQMLRLFQELGYDIEGTSKFDLMQYVRDGDEFATKFAEYQVLFKAYSSYYKTYLELLDENDRLHGGFFVQGTKAGRPSCSRPNMFQIAKNSPIKKVMKPDEGYILFSIDYAQVELRIAMSFAGEQVMIDMVKAGEDLHQYTADELSEKIQVEISRHEGKTSNFGLAYGMGYRKFATTNAVEMKKAEAIVTSWRKLYPNMRAILFECLDLASRWRAKPNEPNGKKVYRYIQIPVSGRVRRFHEPYYIRNMRKKMGDFDVLEGETYEEFWQEKVATEDMVMQPFDEMYSAWNNIVQGTAWGVMENAIEEVADYYTGTDLVRYWFPVYDSLVFQVKQGYEADIVPHVVRIMEDYDSFAVPLTVDVEASIHNYKDMIEWERDSETFEQYMERIYAE